MFEDRITALKKLWAASGQKPCRAHAKGPRLTTLREMQAEGLVAPSGRGFILTADGHKLAAALRDTNWTDLELVTPEIKEPNVYWIVNEDGENVEIREGKGSDGYAYRLNSANTVYRLEKDADETMITGEFDFHAEPYEPAPEWHVAHNDHGALLYTLREDGYRRGEPIMVNDVMIKIEAANGSETDLDPIIAKVIAALS